MRWLLGVLLVVPSIVAPPPRRDAAQAQQAQETHQQQPQPGQQEHQQQQEEIQKPRYMFTYNKYLEEVVKILESDPKFNEKIKDMKEEDIKAGAIADHIEDLDEGVFNQLTLAKAQEIERLRNQIEEQIKADGHANNIKLPDHLDVQNWEKFGKEDLRKLIQKTVADMNVEDERRKEEFKEYEMKKKAEEDHRLAQMSEDERKRAIAEDEAREARHNEHEKLKHPGSRDQLEEVWEDGDHMDKDSFDPKTFFRLHDINGDGYWNTEELETLFQLELDKMYNETNPDDDPREKFEEMNRMREHVMTQMDKNQDRLISMEEFMQDNEAQTADKDPGWDDLGKNHVYTDEELKKFEEEYAQQQGWGEGAYRTSTAPVTAPLQQQQQQQQHQQQQQQQQQQQGHQPAQPVQAEVHYNQGQPPAQPVHQQPQAPGQQQIHDLPKDPSYGI